MGGEQETDPLPRGPIARRIVFGLVVAFGVFVDVCTYDPALDAHVRIVESMAVAQYVVLAGVSIFAAQWPLILLLNFAAGVAYVVATRWRAKRLLSLRVSIVGMNRRVGHLEVLFPWVVLSFSFPWHSLLWTARLAALGWLVLFGPGAVDWVTRESSRRLAKKSLAPTNSGAGVRPPAASGGSVVDQWRFRVKRRFTLLAASVVGFVILGVVARSQILVVCPLIIAFVVGVAFRVLELADDPPRDVRDPRYEVIRRALDSARTLDAWFFLASQVVLTLFVWSDLYPGAAAAAEDVQWRQRPEHLVGGGSVPPPENPIRLFVLSDSQLHELTGERAAVHLDLVEGIVKVAVRPVELDLLSIFTVARFERARLDLEDATRRALPWIHLGDFGDLGCESEIERFPGMGADAEHPQGILRPLAIVAGNHDSTFCGNFAWHPSWDPACGARPRASKPWTDRKLAAWSPTSKPLESMWSPYMPGVATLGFVDGREVIGVFMDTSDDTLPSLGIAGVLGEISHAQARWISDALAAHHDALAVLFMHHPFAELSLLSRLRLGGIVDEHEGRILGLVSAHTHLAGLRWPQVGSRDLPEIVVGSTIDPPQEAAMLEIGRNALGKVGMRLVTIPAVARRRATCTSGGDPAVKSDVCEALWREVRRSCPALVAEVPDANGHPRTPREVKKQQQGEARTLLDCLETLRLLSIAKADPEELRRLDIDPATAEWPLDDPGLSRKIDAVAARLTQATDAESRTQLDRLACLSWAGSVLQGRPRGSSSYASALAEATDQLGPSVATEIVVDDTGGVQRACEAPGSERSRMESGDAGQ